MYIIWRTDFDNGLNIILENNIISEEVLPFKAFNHKNKELYLYNKKWEKCSNKILQKIFNKIQTELIRRHMNLTKNSALKKPLTKNI